MAHDVFFFLLNWCWTMFTLSFRLARIFEIEKGLNVLLCMYKIQFMLYNIFWLDVELFTYINSSYICSEWYVLFSTFTVYSYTNGTNRHITCTHEICEKYFGPQRRKIIILCSFYSARSTRESFFVFISHHHHERKILTINLLHIFIFVGLKLS